MYKNSRQKNTYPHFRGTFSLLSKDMAMSKEEVKKLREDFESLSDEERARLRVQDTSWADLLPFGESVRRRNWRSAVGTLIFGCGTAAGAYLLK